MGQTLNKNKKNQEFKSREEYLIKNGGILLEKQIALSKGRQKEAGQLKIFSDEDIRKATNNYDLNLIVARSYLRNIYKGTLGDRVVTVKAPRHGEPHPDIFAHHLTEASMSMVMNHDNVVKLYGCCLETPIPILVHEFFPNSSLFDHLHVDIASSKPIRWADRLRIATETGYALSYMHNALSKPVVHRHLSSHIILLDTCFSAKLSNFGFSIPLAIAPEQPPKRWPVEGVPGYIDPEYINTQEVTDKCDVYSFGVLMLELLTRRKPYMTVTGGTSFVDAFISVVEKDCMMEMIDSEVFEQATRDEIQAAAHLALTCVAKIGDDRPTMVEVVEQLWHIRRQENK